MRGDDPMSDDHGPICGSCGHEQDGATPCCDGAVDGPRWCATGYLDQATMAPGEEWGVDEWLGGDEEPRIYCRGMSEDDAKALARHLNAHAWGGVT